MKLTYTGNKVVAAAVLVVFMLAAINYHFHLGFFGRYAKFVMVLTLGVGVIYCAFFMPTRRQMHEHLEATDHHKGHNEL